MTDYPVVHELGRVDVVEREDAAALSDVPDDLATVQAAWPAVDELFARADHDASRPHIEHYRREGEVDCLVPVLPAR